MSVETQQSVTTDIRSRVHPNCVVCSSDNAKGLHLEFVPADDGCIIATFQCDKAFEGYSGFLHGGMSSSVLDGSMTHCMFAHGKTAVTAEMSTKFRHPILIRQMAAVSARIKRSSHPLYILEAQIVQASQVKATATGKFLDQPQLLIQRQISYDQACLHNDTR